MSRDGEIRGLLAAAWKYRGRDDYDSARENVRKAEKLCEEEDDHLNLGRVFHIFAQFESDQEKYTEAFVHLRRSLEFYKMAGDPDRIAHSTRHVADLERKLGKLAESEADYGKAIEIYRSIPETDECDLANALRGYALVLELRRKNSEAVTVWKEVKDLYRVCGLQAGVDEAETRLRSLKGEGAQ